MPYQEYQHIAVNYMKQPMDSPMLVSFRRLFNRILNDKKIKWINEK